MPFCFDQHRRAPAPGQGRAAAAQPRTLEAATKRNTFEKVVDGRPTDQRPLSKIGGPRKHRAKKQCLAKPGHALPSRRTRERERERGKRI